ncbi:MAG: 1-(5-phosphoribosyl)-5-((5-phosphoribosylamino)methylideneamino)imidazole-4-carboxamide isomerase, partial [Chloroflexi bacterium]
MLIVPAIDLLGGRAVRLLRGNYEVVTDYGDPLEALRRWRDAGTALVHVVDLDGARSGKPTQIETIRSLAAEGVPLEVGGGVRGLEDVEMLVCLGVERVVLGTVAVEDSAVLNRALDRYADRIVAALDARDGNVVTRGWKCSTSMHAVALGRSLAAAGVQRFLSTDVQRDGTLTEPNYDELAALLAATAVPVIASGG